MYAVSIFQAIDEVSLARKAATGSPSRREPSESEAHPGLSDQMKLCLERAFTDALMSLSAREGTFVDQAEKATPSSASLPGYIRASCADLVREGRETCRLAALTALAATAAVPTVRPDKLQVGAGGVDVRTLYKQAVRPVLISKAAEVNAVWQPSADPYVSNPFRENLIDAAWVLRRKNKLPGADQLLVITQHIVSNPSAAQAILADLVLHEFARLLESRVEYRIPHRLTTAIVEELLKNWLQNDSRGQRLESVAVTLLRFTGRHITAGWDEVESHHVNDPTPYDALCKKAGEVRVVGEVKDVPLTLHHLRQLADQMNVHRAHRGYMFTGKSWWPSHPDTEADAIAKYIQDRSVLGQRIDIVEVMEAARVWLALIDQDDATLPEFVQLLTQEVDEHAPSEDRRALAGLINRL
jgi:hypothetical protein